MNNECSNLEWVTIQENIQKGYETGLFANCQKSVQIVHEEGVLVFPSMAEASRFLGRNNGYVSNCIKLNRPIIGSDGKQYIVKDVKQ